MITREPDADDLRRGMESEAQRWTSAIAVLEASLGVSRKLEWTLLEAKAYLDRLLDIAGIEILPIGPREGD